MWYGYCMYKAALSKTLILTIIWVDNALCVDISSDVMVLKFARFLLFHEWHLLLVQMLKAMLPVEFSGSTHRFSEQMSYQSNHLTVTVGGFRIGEARQSRWGLKSSSFGLHFGCFAALRFRKLGGNDDQAQVNHKERTNLRKDNNTGMKLELEDDILQSPLFKRRALHKVKRFVSNSKGLDWKLWAWCTFTVGGGRYQMAKTSLGSRTLG